MATEEQMQRALDVFYDGLSCAECGASVRVGEYECAHCASDFEELLRQWAASLVDAVLASPRRSGDQ